VVAPTAATTQLTVQSTPTALSIETAETETDAQNISVTGTLTTETGEPLADRTLQLRLGETPLETIQTDDTGQYQTTLDRSRVQGENSSVLTVQFAASGSNLESSMVEQTLSLSATTPGRQLAVVGGALLVVIAGGLLLVRWQFTTQWVRLHSWLGGRTAEREAEPVIPAATQSGDTGATESAADAASGESLRERAQTALEAGDADAAVQLAYAAFRHQTPGPVDRSQTHWEVYNQWRATNQPDASQVRQLTTAYEQATFASEPVSIETAQTILEELPSLTDTPDTSV
jgi:hypothetical protein